jgi:DNA (cytosine-5)-methyltransferase 1|tara:strand:- start:662 stop:1735 length:1074 start_codon:yes stop_codon:yes gene_type:complete
MKLKHLDLFSGIGGFSLGLEEAGLVETIAFCDYEPYCQKILKKHWPKVPIYNNIKELNYETLKQDGIKDIDIITGGYPCQPFSVAGKQRAEKDPRHLWPEMFRLIKECRPTWVIGENVSGHIKLGLDTVISDLESEGYSTRTFNIPASGVGALHQRQRIWIISHTNEHGSHQEKRDETEQSSDWEKDRVSIRNGNDVSYSDKQRTQIQIEGKHSSIQMPRGTSEKGRVTTTTDPNCKDVHQQQGNIRSSSNKFIKEDFGGLRKDISSTEDVAHTNSEGTQKLGQHNEMGSRVFENSSKSYTSSNKIGKENWWGFEPRVGRVVDGIPDRVDRIKCLGNSVVPQIPYLIGLSILQAINK